MNKLQQKARKYFNDYMSGEPLTQEAVEDALVEFAQLERVAISFAIDFVFKKHKDKLNTIKDNLSRSDEENWSSSDIRESERMIKLLAEILSDLNKIKD